MLVLSLVRPGSPSRAVGHAAERVLVSLSGESHGRINGYFQSQYAHSFPSISKAILNSPDCQNTVAT